MSEPTYRVDLSHHPEHLPYPWRGVVVRLSDEQEIKLTVGESREDAFARALQFVHDLNRIEPQHPSSVYLSEDGDLLDPHDSPLRSVS